MCGKNSQPIQRRAAIGGKWLDMLYVIDCAGVLHESNMVQSHSFLLDGDGHPSHFEIPFLDYIHDAWHDWVTCIWCAIV